MAEEGLGARRRRRRVERIARTAAGVLLLAVIPPGSAWAGTVGQWGRQVIPLGSSTYSGNPFELEVDATFTHTSSGTEIVLPGYYAGGDTWKIGFMPTLPGEWTWTTSSIDPDLDTQTGSVTCVASARRGLLAADGKKWRYASGDFVVPIGVFTQLMHGAGSAAEIDDFAGFLQAHNIHLVNFRLCEQDICFDSVDDLTMDLALWDRLEARLETLAEHGVGADVMLYTDDGGKPSFAGQSPAERLLVRYAVARLAGFPTVYFNSGIDIWEYRSADWHDWYGNLVKSLDPYGHPVSSRGSPSADTSFMSAGVRTYNSNGARNSTFSRMLDAFNAAAEPSANDDNFGEDRTGINGHTPGDIRRTGWKALLAAGVGFQVRHNENNDCANGITQNCDNPFTVADIETQLDSEQWLKLVQQFSDQKLGAVFGSLLPESGLVGNGLAVADPARTTIVYLYLGINDSWDAGSSDPLEVKLTGLLDDYDASWFDPRTGVESSIGVLPGGRDHAVDTPTNDDWVLLLTAEPPTRRLAVTPPTGGAVTSTPAGIDCGADCQEDFQVSTVVELDATPEYGSEFDGWDGDSDCWDGWVTMIVDTICGALFGPCTIPSIVELPPQTTAPGAHTFEACNELRAGTGGFVVAASSDTSFEATNLIVLADGFSVESGAVFRARNGD